MIAPRVEIWIIAGSHWRLPVRVVWHQNLGECRPGAGANLTKKMRAAVEQVLEPLGNTRGFTYWIDREKLEMVGRKYEGDDPEDCIEWLPSRQEPVRVREDFKPEDFIRAFCASHFSLIHDTLLMDAIWVNLKAFMLHWLLNERQSVDLGFARLDALNLRKNWAQIVMYRDRLTGNRRVDMNFEEMTKRKATELLCSTELLAAHRDTNLIRWTLECTTNEQWDKATALVEEEHRRVRRGNRYRFAVWDQMVRQLPALMRIYARYIQEATRPTARLVEGFANCLPYERLRLHSPSDAIPFVAPWARGDEVPNAMEEGDEEPLVQKDATLHEALPDLRPQEQNVRNSGGTHLPGQ